MTRLRGILVAGTVLLAVIVGLMMSRSEETAQAKPPPVDRNTAHIVFGSSSVRTGELLTFTVRNPGREPFEFGLAMTVDRWDGAAWKAAYQAAAALTGAGGAQGKDGRLVPPGQTLDVPAIALEAPAGGAGPGEQIRLTGVPPGWYRLVIPRVGGAPPGGAPSAVGVFQVLS